MRPGERLHATRCTMRSEEKWRWQPAREVRKRGVASTTVAPFPLVRPTLSRALVRLPGGSGTRSRVDALALLGPCSRDRAVRYCHHPRADDSMLSCNPRRKRAANTPSWLEGPRPVAA